MSLWWFPKFTDWSARLQQARTALPEQIAASLQQLANADIDFLQTVKLDRVLATLSTEAKAKLNRTPTVRLAILGSCTMTHLLPAIRVGALRRGFLIETYEGHYGSYLQELSDPSSGLYNFKPDFVLLALDAHHAVDLAGRSVDECMNLLRSCWQLARTKLGATLIQQTVLPAYAPLLGNQEHIYAGSPASLIATLNQRLREETAAERIPQLALDSLVLSDGLTAWFDPALWYRSKQEVNPIKSPEYGEEVARLLGAIRGLSAKCLVLDLDNTVWGGVIGDDGLEGIALGQNNAVGEAFVGFQQYARLLGERGVILAVCSKNDEANAKLPFESHPEMHLRLKDIACFVANWKDKATNLRHIAKTLNIGLDALVFADDNPFERNLVRQELPMVSVPEMPEDPALYELAIARGGYFESLSLTDEDKERNQQYRANMERESLRSETTDLASYLDGLKMQMLWAPFDAVGMPRIVQLINKSNQFNLTTHRYTEEQAKELAADPKCLTLQLRLLDRYGDNGMIAVLIARESSLGVLYIDTWLMSCRVLGRKVEEVTLDLLVAQAKRMGARQLIGEYIPSAKNNMVREHYSRLGFVAFSASEDGAKRWTLDLATYTPYNVNIQLVEGTLDQRRDLHPAH
jgi:FkbH-like protein